MSDDERWNTPGLGLGLLAAVEAVSGAGHFAAQKTEVTRSLPRTPGWRCGFNRSIIGPASVSFAFGEPNVTTRNEWMCVAAATLAGAVVITSLAVARSASQDPVLGGSGKRVSSWFDDLCTKEGDGAWLLGKEAFTEPNSTSALPYLATQLKYRLIRDQLVTYCFQAPVGVVGWWPGDDTANDVVGGDNGTISSGVTFTNAMVGEGFRLDGAKGRINLPDSLNLKFTTSLSIECWVFVAGFPDARNDFGIGAILFRGDNRPGLDPYILEVRSNGTIQFHVENAQNQAADISAIMPIRRFVHVAATLDDATGNMMIYLDGRLVALQVTFVRPFAELDPTAAPGICIGNYPNTAYKMPFNGIIDELRVYNRALTQAEVQQIFDATGGRPGLRIAPSPVRISWSSVANRSYQVHYRSTLATNAWLNLGIPIVGTGSTISLTNEISGPQAFYQVVLLPCSL